MDPNITGRPITPLPPRTKLPIGLITVLGLTPASHGNATGIGGADLTTVSVAKQIDRNAMYTNVFTSGALTAAKLPVIVNNDEQAIRLAVCCVPKKPQDVRVVHILDTLHMTEIQISEKYLPELSDRSDIEVLDQGEPFRFTSEGTLLSVWDRR